MPLSEDASGLAKEVPSPIQLPHARPQPPPPTALFPAAPDAGVGARAGIYAAAGVGVAAEPGQRGRRTLPPHRRARPPCRTAQPLAPPPDRLRRAGLGRAGRTPAPRSPAEAHQARHKLPGALAEASRTGQPPAPFPRGPAVAPAPTPHTRSPGGDPPKVQGPHPSSAPEFTSKSRPLFLKFLSRWLSSFSLSAMAGPVTPSPARAPRDPPQPPRCTDTPRNRAAA